MKKYLLILPALIWNLANAQEFELTQDSTNRITMTVQVSQSVDVYGFYFKKYDEIQDINQPWQAIEHRLVHPDDLTISVSARMPAGCFVFVVAEHSYNSQFPKQHGTAKTRCFKERV